MSWDKLSMHKKDGGMGFKSLGTFNLSKLGNKGWRIMTNPQTTKQDIFSIVIFLKLHWGINQVLSGEVFVMLNSSLEREAGGR